MSAIYYTYSVWSDKYIFNAECTTGFSDKSIILTIIDVYNRYNKYLNDKRMIEKSKST